MKPPNNTQSKKRLILCFSFEFHKEHKSPEKGVFFLSISILKIGGENSANFDSASQVATPPPLSTQSGTTQTKLLETSQKASPTQRWSSVRKSLPSGS